MAARKHRQDSVGGILERIAQKVRALEDIQRRRALPPGFEWSVTGEALAIRRVSDGAQQVVAFGVVDDE